MQEVQLRVVVVLPLLDIHLQVGAVATLNRIEREVSRDGHFDRIIEANERDTPVKVLAPDQVTLGVHEQLEWAISPRGKRVHGDVPPVNRSASPMRNSPERSLGRSVSRTTARVLFWKYGAGLRVSNGCTIPSNALRTSEDGTIAGMSSSDALHTAYGMVLP